MTTYRVRHAHQQRQAAGPAAQHHDACPVSDQLLWLPPGGPHRALKCDRRRGEPSRRFCQPGLIPFGMHSRVCARAGVSLFYHLDRSAFDRWPQNRLQLRLLASCILAPVLRLWTIRLGNSDYDFNLVTMSLSSHSSITLVCSPLRFYSWSVSFFTCRTANRLCLVTTCIAGGHNSHLRTWKFLLTLIFDSLFVALSVAF